MATYFEFAVRTFNFEVIAEIAGNYITLFITPSPFVFPPFTLLTSKLTISANCKQNEKSSIGFSAVSLNGLNCFSLSVSLSVFLSVFLSVCLSFYLSVCLLVPGLPSSYWSVVCAHYVSVYLAV